MKPETKSDVCEICGGDIVYESETYSAYEFAIWKICDECGLCDRVPFTISGIKQHTLKQLFDDNFNAAKEAGK